MLRPALLLVGTAAVASAVDLAHKASTGAAHFHGRSVGYVAFVLVLSAVWAAAIVLTRSPAIALGGGVVAGGAVGNVLSLAFWPGVPNPIAVSAVAFNLADLFVAVGFVFVACTALGLTPTGDERLREPIRLR